MQNTIKDTVLGSKDIMKRQNSYPGYPIHTHIVNNAGW